MEIVVVCLWWCTVKDITTNNITMVDRDELQMVFTSHPLDYLPP